MSQEDRLDDRHQTDTPDVDFEAVKRDFGRAVKRCRQEEGLSQAALAKEWQFARTTIANCETQGGVSAHLYLLARERYTELPTILQYEDGTRDLDSLDPKYADGAEFEKMLIDRTRSRNTLLGTWNALWQTEVDGEELFNSETLEFSPLLRKRLMITNPSASLENPVGGYSWRAECRFFDNDALLGVYSSTSDLNGSCGALQMKVHISGQYIDGQWIGEGYDRVLARGHVVFCRDRTRLVPRLQLLLDRTIDFKFATE